MFLLSRIVNSSSLLQKLQSFNITVRNATKKAGGTVKNGRDSPGKRLGVKKLGGERVIPGTIIIRQRGLTYRVGKNVGLGRDFTLYALTEGQVSFFWNTVTKKQIVSVLTPEEFAAVELKKRTKKLELQERRAASSAKMEALAKVAGST
jgi:large subunit ribosomal protein L27